MSKWYGVEIEDEYTIYFEDNNGMRSGVMSVWKGPRAAQLPQPAHDIADRIVTYLNGHDDKILDALSAKQKDRLLAEAINWIERELFHPEKNISHD